MFCLAFVRAGLLPYGLVWGLLLALSPTLARGVILFGTGDPNANASEPAGPLAGSGWQYQGLWGDFLGTPIAQHFFITAIHIGGSVGGRFIFQGHEFRATAMFDDPESDIRIWRICETFPLFAPLYSDADELGKPLVVFGRGTKRGEPVLASDGLRGWKWGDFDGRLRWGENQVSQFVDNEELDAGSAKARPKALLQATFDTNGGTNEAHLSVGDSGGGVFIKDSAGIWKLAGINFAADAQYNTTTNGPGFLACLFDARGFYEGRKTIGP